MTLIDAIPPHWRKLIKTDTHYVNIQSQQDNLNVAVKVGQTSIPIDKLTNKLIYNKLREKSAKPSTSEKNLKDDIGETDISVVYRMPFIVTKSTTLQYFQFKTNHVFFSNKLLSEASWEILHKSLRTGCQIIDDLERYFIMCQIVTPIWQQYNNFIELTFEKLIFSKTEILCGILKTDRNRFH